MKVRAKVKAREYLPNWAKCCDGPMMKDGKDDAEILVDLGRTFIKVGGACCWCHAPFPKHKCVWASGSGEGWFPIEVLDLDEGPMEAQ